MRETLIQFLDELREYISESGNDLSNDERESSEFVDIFFNKKIESENKISKRELLIDWEKSQYIEAGWNKSKEMVIEKVDTYLNKLQNGINRI